MSPELRTNSIKSHQPTVRKKDSPHTTQVNTASSTAQLIHSMSLVQPDLSLRTSNAQIIGHPGRREVEIVFGFVLEGTFLYETGLCSEIVYDSDSIRSSSSSVYIGDSSSGDDTSNCISNTDNNLTSLQSNTPHYSYLIHCTTLSGRTGRIQGYHPEYCKSVLQSTPLLTVPLKTRTKGYITFHVNESKKIDKFDMRCVQIS
jgi:hypothetical protein